jgi:hypothetical protein
MTNRRGFFGAMFAAAVAPAIVRAESLMKIYVLPQGIITDVQLEEALYQNLSARYSHSLTKSCLLTRQQVTDDLLRSMNKLFELEYSK